MSRSSRNSIRKSRSSIKSRRKRRWRNTPGGDCGSFLLVSGEDSELHDLEKVGKVNKTFKVKINQEKKK